MSAVLRFESGLGIMENAVFLLIPVDLLMDEGHKDLGKNWQDRDWLIFVCASGPS